MNAAKNLVILSVNMPGDGICVDVFQRPDASFGFEEFRRDPEDGRGWFPIGHYSHQVFDTFEQAKGAAVSAVDWLGDAM